MKNMKRKIQKKEKNFFQIIIINNFYNYLKQQN